MATETEKKVRRLFILGSPKKKGQSGRLAAAQTVKVNPLLVRFSLILVVALTAVLLILPAPQSDKSLLNVGDVADRDIKAKQEFMVLDRMATEEKRQAVGRNAPTVFDLDDQAGQKATARIHELFGQGRKILQTPPASNPLFSSPDSMDSPDQALLTQLAEKFHLAFHFDPEDKLFETLAEARFSPQVERIILSLFGDFLERGIVADRGVLLEQSGSGVLVRRIYSKEEDLISYFGIFHSLEEARRIVMERALLHRDDFGPRQIKAMVAAAQAMLWPNLTINRQETEARREAAVREVAPVFFRVKRGEMIVREGEKVDWLARQKLEAQASQSDQRDWFSKAGGILLMVTVFLVVTYLVGLRILWKVRLKDRDLIFLTTLLVLNLLLAFTASQVGEAMGRNWTDLSRPTILYLTPVAAGGMLAAIFLGPSVGLIFSVIVSALTALLTDHGLELFFYFFLGTIAGLAGVARVRERGTIIKSGALISLVNIGSVAALALIHQTFISKDTLLGLGAGVLNGLLVGITVTGLIPFFEMLFRYTTSIKLLELVSLDRPILRELMVQAPGTYHHSVIVGALVEAAAEAIGADPLLAKVSAYYHDLGKLKKPLYFVENQGAGQNKHEKLAPSMSSLILISHIKDGVELARQHKLSQEIVDIIQQHHGTSLIAYFYKKAQDGRTPDQPEINIEDFRYPGPKPQTREAGLVMLADVVEAAGRTLTEPTPARVQGMVQKLINNIFSDGQLDECELTLKDLHLIARSFNKILTGIYHRRIDYPEQPAKESAPRAKTANGNHQTKQSAKEIPDKGRPGQEPGKEDLRRLGMS